MYTAEILFKRRKDDRQCDERHEDAIWGVLTALERNGQLVDRDFPVVISQDGYKAIVGLPEKTSLRAPLFSSRVRKALAGLRKCGLELLKAGPIGRDLGSRPVCKCRKQSALILETGLLTTEVPLWCGECRGTVPLYRIPHTTDHGTYEDIRYWVHRYRVLDELWIDSGVGEQFGYRELSRHDSDLSKTGRDICRRIEQLTRTRTYYYLYRWYARSAATDRRRPCPSCGKKWLVEPPWLGRYEFRCDRCRLVSNIGFDVR
jgi:predicted  nucleic acid-binding Zn ribbon protein